MKKKDRVEVIAMIGVFGMLISVCEMYPYSLISPESSFHIYIYIVSHNFPLLELW